MYIKNIAFIPARKNSKRIRNKNLSKINGQSLISIVLKNIKRTKIFNEIFVASDDIKIKKLAKKLGSNTTYIRPKNLSDDFTPVTDLVSHFSSWIEKKKIKCDIISLIYPTSIFIKPIVLEKSYKIFIKNNVDYLLPIKKFPQPIERGFFVNKNSKIQKQNKLQRFNKRTQDGKILFYDAGQFCFGKFKAWKKKKQIFSSNTLGVDISDEITVDIDWPKDLKIAQKLSKLL